LQGIKKRKEKRERHGLGSSWPNSNLNLSLIEKKFENPPLGFPRFPDVNNKLWPKFDNF
jgi:hypothetical protein